MPKYFEEGNPGRPKGSKNKKTEQWEKFREWFMSEGMGRLQEEMGKLKGKEFVNKVQEMLEYFQPKLSRTEHTGADGDDLEINVVIHEPGSK